MTYWFETLSNTNILWYVVPDWKSYVSVQLDYLKSKSCSTETGAYYSSQYNKMFFSPSKSIEGGVRTMLHEYGHFILHNAFNYDETNRIIALIFKKEIKTKKISTEEEALKFLNSLKKEFLGSYSNSLVPISDGLGIYFNTEIFLSNGYRSHEKGYSSSHMGTELFAELFQMIVMGDYKGLMIFKREFPKTYYYLSKKINGLRK